MTTNPNEMPTYGLSREQTDAMFERTCRQQVAEAAERRRVAAWPGMVDQFLRGLLGRSDEARQAQADTEARLAAIDARLAALESAMGTGRH